MAIAGRVAIIPKGEWSENITYDKLDLVTRNGNAYIAYKSSTGVEPVDGDTWMLIMESVSTDDVNKLKEDVEAILNGTTPVGDSNKLGGKRANEYALQSDLIPYDGEILYNPILEEALSYTEDGVHNYRLAGSNYTGNDIPNTYYRNGQATVITRVAYGNKVGTTVILWGVNTIQRIAINHYTATGWAGWKEFATTADLANYLPLTGGTVTGSGVPLGIKATATYRPLIQFDGTNGRCGFLGFYGADTPCVLMSDATTTYNLLHTGNKPSGSYTGTGASRTVSTSGTGQVCFICSYGQPQYGFTIAFPSGGFKMALGGSPVYSDAISFANGVLTVDNGENPNMSGVTYYYHVL